MSPTPPRTPGSVRRTTSVDATWPTGELGPLHLSGQARDLHTSATGDRVVGAGTMTAVLVDRLLTELRTARPLDLDALLGDSVGSGFRRRLAAAVPAELAAGSPTHQLLDDLVGCGIVSEFALRQWQLFELTPAATEPPRRVLGFCTGFADGSSALNPDGSSTGDHRTLEVGPLPRPDDPAGWHPLPEVEGVSMRRARRIDARRTPAGTEVDAMFQDSSTDPGGGRVAVHEYRISARTDAAGTITAIEAVPRTLPYAECPFAAGNLGRLVGTPLGELRAAVPVALRGTAGCTHLNDAVRALGDVPDLLASAGL